jgi:hypothetical protein
MNTENHISLAHTNFEAGHSIERIAQEIVRRDPDIHAVELITILKTTFASKRRDTHEASMLSFGMDSVDPIVTDAIYYASITMTALPQTTPSELAVALKDPQNFPQLTALQMGEVLKAEGVFPGITAQQTQDALNAAQYAPADVSAAVNQLFPQPVQYRRIGPFGAAGQMPFDDNDLATTQPLTQLIVRCGNIIDGIQAFYGDSLVATPIHGGSGGGQNTLPLSDDPIIEVSGFTGYWFGANYVLQLTIKTRSQTYNPFGDMAYANGEKTPFTLKAEVNEEIVGFFGTATYGNNGQSIFLGSLGAIVKSQ